MSMQDGEEIRFTRDQPKILQGWPDQETDTTGSAHVQVFTRWAQWGGKNWYERFVPRSMSTLGGVLMM